MVIQVIIRLTLYLDQAIMRNGRDFANENMSGIQNTVNIWHIQILSSNCNVCVCLSILCHIFHIHF